MKAGSAPWLGRPPVSSFARWIGKRASTFGNQLPDDSCTLSEQRQCLVGHAQECDLAGRWQSRCPKLWRCRLILRDIPTLASWPLSNARESRHGGLVTGRDVVGAVAGEVVIWRVPLELPGWIGKEPDLSLKACGSIEQLMYRGNCQVMTRSRNVIEGRTRIVVQVWDLESGTCLHAAVADVDLSCSLHPGARGGTP